MSIREIIADKQLKPKERTEAISGLLLDHSLSAGELIDFAGDAKDTVKATCIEALEYASAKDPGIISPAAFEFAVSSLSEKAPRVKWESAKVIGNSAHLHEGKLDAAVKKLIDNTEHEGTVVRWSAAFALGQILKMDTPMNRELVPAAKVIMENEEKNSIRKIYQQALKKAGVKV